jgi:D-3-phosphoglycerate dehydrogenase
LETAGDRKVKILVTSKSFGQNTPAITELEKHGFKIIRSNTTTPVASDIREQIKGIDAIVVGNNPVDESVINAADRLKLIHMHGTGLDAIDVEAATRKGIYVANAPGANKNAVAELTVLLMLALARQFSTHVDSLKAGEWERRTGHELSNSTVGIIGTGNIGRRVTELLKGFNVKIIAYDPFMDTSWAANHNVNSLKDSDAIFKNADWVVLSLPLTDKTRHLVNDHTLSLMKPGAYLVNTARGGLVDEEALCRAVRDKRIAGAALDTFIDEPPAMDSPLRSGGILMTPHIGALSIETAYRVSQSVVKNIIDILIHNNTKAAVNAEKINSL